MSRYPQIYNFYWRVKDTLIKNKIKILRYSFDENFALFSYDSKIHLFFQQLYCRQHCFYAFGFILCFDWTDQELRRSCLICVNKLFKVDLLILQLVVKAFTGEVNHLSFKWKRCITNQSWNEDSSKILGEGPLILDPWFWGYLQHANLHGVG